MVRIFLPAFALAALLACGGCASIVNGRTQAVSVTTQAGSDPVSGATCTLDNGEGQWSVTTPGTATVRRSHNDLRVSCVSAGRDKADAAIESRVSGAVFGNLLLGGPIGFGVDFGVGTAYRYQETIMMTFAAAAAVPAPVAMAPRASDAVASPVKPAAAVTTAQADVPAPMAPAMPSAPVAPAPAPAAIAIKPAEARPVLPPMAAPTAAPRLAPAAAGTARTTKLAAAGPGGQDAFQAARTARDATCESKTRPSLLDKGPGYEVYNQSCDDGRALNIRCDFGNCRVQL